MSDRPTSINYKPCVIQDGSSHRMVVEPVYSILLGSRWSESTPERAARILGVHSLLKPAGSQEVALSSLLEWDTAEDINEGYKSLLEAWRDGTEKGRNAIESNCAVSKREEYKAALWAGIYGSLQPQFYHTLVAVDDTHRKTPKTHEADIRFIFSKRFADLYNMSVWGSSLDWYARTEAVIRGSREILQWLRNEIPRQVTGDLYVDQARVDRMHHFLGDNQKAFDTFAEGTRIRSENGLSDILSNVEAKHGKNPAYRARMEESLGRLSLTDWRSLHTCLSGIVHAAREGWLSEAVLNDLGKLDALELQQAVRNWDEYQDKLNGAVSDSTVSGNTTGLSRSQKKRAKKAQQNKTKSDKSSLMTSHGWTAGQRGWTTGPQVFVDLSEEYSGLTSENLYTALERK